MEEHENMYVPPYTNRGVQNTEKTEKNPTQESLRSLVDWVQGTVFGVTPVQIIENFFELNVEWFKDLKKGMYGYQNTIAFGHIMICYNNIETPQGTHIKMSGQGCREFEAYAGRPWADLFRDILSRGHMTRLDIAIDDFEGFFTVKKLKRKVEKGELLSRFKKARSQESIKIKDGEDAGDTLYFGSGSSAIQIRFYDKLKEREAKGKTVEVDFWHRTEIQARDKRANKIAEFIVGKNSANAQENETIGEIVKGILAYYLRFVDRPKASTAKNDAGDSNKSRWETSNFWKKYLNDIEKIKLTDVAPDRTIDTIHEWLTNQTSRSLATIYKAHGENIDVIKAIIDNGISRMTENDLKMARDFYGEEVDEVDEIPKEERMRIALRMFYNMPNEEQAKYGTYWGLYDYLYRNEP